MRSDFKVRRLSHRALVALNQSGARWRMVTVNRQPQHGPVRKPITTKEN